MALSSPAPAKPKAAGTRRAATPERVSLSLDEAMSALEQAGKPSYCKTYVRHGATGPLFGVSSDDLGKLRDRIGFDDKLARALWKTGNADARCLAIKICDPASMPDTQINQWVRETTWSLHLGLLARLAVSMPSAQRLAESWLVDPVAPVQAAGWVLAGCMALREPTVPEPWFVQRIQEIQATIQRVDNEVRAQMNQALIAIAGRSTALRERALDTADRLGVVHVDHGDTACKTPAARPAIEKMWAHAEKKGFASPAAQELARSAFHLR